MTKWKCPQTLPDLSGYPCFSLDVETRDPYIKDKGPGAYRGDSYIVGIAIGAPDGKRWYLPFRHETGAQLDRDQVLSWARVELCRPGQPKVLANALYDLCALDVEGVQVTGPFWDVQNAEPLLDENRGRYNLDSLALEYLGEGKDETLMEQACEIRGLKGKPQAHIWCLPAEYVGPYAEADVDRTLRVWELQRPKLVAEGLWPVFELETDLVEVLLAMRRRGVRIDVERAKQARIDLQARLDLSRDRLTEIAGEPVEYWANESVAAACDRLGVEYPRTRAGAPSFRSYWLTRCTHELAHVIVECRKLDKLISTFVEGAVLDCVVNERIHCQLNQLRGDDFGTVTGRLSCAIPNLQQIPKGEDDGASLIRSFFVPEPGELWGRADYAQVELRILAHYGIGDGAEELRQVYAENPQVDFHERCAKIINVSRAQSKPVNLGIIYGMGQAKLAKQLGLELEEAKVFLKRYYETFPFLKNTANLAANTARSRGYVHTILGRRRRFPVWEPADWDLSQQYRDEPHEPEKDARAVMEWVEQQIRKARSEGRRCPRRGVQRAFAYKALNSVIQGTAADLLKQAMVNVHRSGVTDVLGPALLSVHDELCFSVPNTREGREAFAEAVRLMETAIPFKVPILADAELKKNWGEPLEGVV